MGERKGQNFYYPPDFDPQKHGNLNRYHGVHALRERAAKIKEGILIIRFEMPFNIWCEGCTRHVAMGVRYNAEKKKVGNYYSTPIWEFKMRCHLCENYFVIRTDPKNFDYELVSGCKRQEKRWQPGDFDGVEHTGRELTQKLASDPMFKLEHGEQDKAKVAEDAPRMEALEDLQERMRDDFGANSALRQEFRSRKKELAAQGVVDAELLAKSSLGNLPLLSEAPQDRQMAALLSRYSQAKDVEERKAEVRQRIDDRSIFAAVSPTTADTPSTSSSDSSGGLAAAAKRLYTKNRESAEAFRHSVRRMAASSSAADVKGTPKALLSALVRPAERKRAAEESTGEDGGPTPKAPAPKAPPPSPHTPPLPTAPTDTPALMGHGQEEQSPPNPGAEAESWRSEVSAQGAGVSRAQSRAQSALLALAAYDDSDSSDD